MPEPVEAMLEEILSCLGLDETPLAVAGSGRLRSVFPVTDLAVASIGAAGASMAELMAGGGTERPGVTVDRALASEWFGVSVRPLGWETLPAWDPVAGDYEGDDGWIRLHTNAERHRAAAQVGPVRRGAGGRPWRRRTLATLLLETVTPSFFSSPMMRR